MSEAVSFWLDNKKVSGITVVAIEDQTLVEYRGKFYIVKNGAALMKGTKPQHFSKTSLPLIWRKALRGEMPALKPVDSSDENLPLASSTKRIRPKKEKEPLPMPETDTTEPTRMLTPPTPAKGNGDAKAPRPVKKIEPKPAPQTSVAAQCPYCNQKQDLALEKGKNGKPFFVTCSKCATDFAVRYVPVTIYQAQVAGFH